MKYSVVVPTLNERGNIVRLLEAIEAALPGDYEVIVVDEHSPDGTLEVVREYAQTHPRVRGESNPGVRGLSPSIVHGFNLAAGEILCCMDGDLQHDAKDLAGLLRTAEEHDFVVGSRYVEGGGFAEKWNPCRVLVSRTATFLAHWLLGVQVRDPMSGFFAIRREAYLSVRERLNPRGFKIMLELLWLLKQTPGNWRVTEYGITFGLRHYGRSKLSGRVIWQYLTMLYTLRRQRQP